MGHGKHKLGPWAKVIYGLIIAVSVVMVWAAVRSFDTAPSVDDEHLLPAGGTQGTQ
jgi:hypothetical protein